MRRLVYERNGRLWGDFRGFTDVGGSREPLIPRGSTYATDNRREAARLYDLRYAELAQKREHERKPFGKIDPLTGLDNRVTLTVLLQQFTDFYKSYVHPSVTVDRRHYTKLIISMLPPSMPVTDLRPLHVQVLLAKLKDDYVSARTDAALSQRTRLKIFRFLQQALDHAMSAEVIDFNPARGRIPRILVPSEKGAETAFYTVSEATRILTALKRGPGDSRPADWPRNTPDFLFEQVAFGLLTGARLNEILAQRWEWVDWEGGFVTLYTSKRIRGEGRDRVTEATSRTVPLWPQLRGILRTYYTRCNQPEGGLLFPAARRLPHHRRHPLPLIERGGRVSKALRTVLRLRGLVTDGPEGGLLFEKRAGYRVGFQEFRVTYCATRLQTVEPVNGRKGEWVPVARRTVELEMGHAGEDMINRVYGRVTKGPQLRLQTVEYRTVVKLPRKRLQLA